MKREASIREVTKNMLNRLSKEDAYVTKRKTYLEKKPKLFQELKDLMKMDTYEKFDRLLVEDRFTYKSKLKYAITDRDHILQQFRNGLRKIYAYMKENNFDNIYILLENKSLMDLYKEIDGLGEMKIWSFGRYLQILDIEFTIDGGDKNDNN